MPRQGVPRRTRLSAKTQDVTAEDQVLDKVLEKVVKELHTTRIIVSDKKASLFESQQAKSKEVKLQFARKVDQTELNEFFKSRNFKPRKVTVNYDSKENICHALVEMNTFENAAALITSIRQYIYEHKRVPFIEDIEWTNKQSRPKNANLKSKGPSPDHRVIAVTFPAFKDENQIRNLAYKVAIPTAVRVHHKPGKNKKFNAFIEMRTHGEAIELFNHIIKNENAEFDCFWSKEQSLKNNSQRKLEKTLQKWGNKKRLMLISSYSIDEKSLQCVLGQHSTKVLKKQLGKEAVNDSYYNSIEFDTSEAALEYFKYANENPSKGVVVQTDNKLNHKPHLSKEETTKLLEEGKLLKGVLRVAKTDYTMGYITNPITDADYLIKGRENQNRAFSGDQVAFRVLDESEWETNPKTGEIKKTGEVVSIMRTVSVNSCAGTFAEQKLTGVHRNNLLFVPMDSRLPRIIISKSELDENEMQTIEASLKNKTIYQVEIIEWIEGEQYATGKLKKTIGDPQDLSVLMESTLVNYGVDMNDIDSTADQDSLPGAEWKIPDEEISKRRDFRKHCVFTIDPATARDLDDALHVIQKENGNYEVGVHIADVTHFVKPKSKIDKEAAERCTSTYMPDRVIPMLPRRLCENLCSLNPAVDRLSFSVVFQLDSTGESIEEPWFGRGIIRSCAKMSYEHAQEIIDNSSSSTNQDVPLEIKNNFSQDEIRTAVLNLRKISSKLRQARKDNGSISINQIKIGFTLEEEAKVPNGFFPYVRKESHKLVEEFMLLANIAVAQKISSHFDQMAFLRCHPPPSEEKLQQLIEELAAQGLVCTAEDSKKLSHSLKQLVENYTGDNMNAFEAALSLMTIKTMSQAKYFCTGSDDIGACSTAHYALSVPYYTHFTSPIRRMPDIVVHRQLAAAVEGSTDFEDCEYTEEGLNELATLCNERKIQAKMAGEEGVLIYLWSMVKQITKNNQFVIDGVVIGMVDFGLDILLYQTGTSVRCYYGEMALLKWNINEQNGQKSVNLDWAKDGKAIGRDSTNVPIQERAGELLGKTKYTYFDTVTVSVTAHELPGRFQGVLKAPADIGE